MMRVVLASTSWHVVAAVAVALTTAPRAHACSKIFAEPFAIAASDAGETPDDQPPTPFRALTASTRRVAATHCHGDDCTTSSCGDEGMLELRFEPPEDDTTAPGELGYRMVWLSGRMPTALKTLTENSWPLGDVTSLTLDLGWDGVTELDGELALIAVDRAGHESVMSAPVHVVWSGCTTYYDDPSCGAVAASSSCSVAAGRSPAHGAAEWAFLLGAVALWRGVRRARPMQRVRHH